MNLRMCENFHRSSHFEEQLNVKESHNVLLVVLKHGEFSHSMCGSFPNHGYWDNVSASKMRRFSWYHSTEIAIARKSKIVFGNSFGRKMRAKRKAHIPLRLSLFFRVINVKSLQSHWIVMFFFFASWTASF